MVYKNFMFNGWFSQVPKNLSLQLKLWLDKEEISQIILPFLEIHFFTHINGKQ